MRYRRKLLILYGLFLLGLAAIWLRVGQLAFVDGDTWEHRARMERTHVERLDAPRGEIVDARGRLLAHDRPVFQLVLHAWSYERRLRARCAKCGVVHFYKNPKYPPRSCACQRAKLRDPYRVQATLPKASEYLVALPPGDLRPLEIALGLDEGELHARAKGRIDQIDEMMKALEDKLKSAEIEEFLIDDRVKQRKNDMLRRPFPLGVDIPLEAVRLLQLDEIGAYRGFGVRTVLRRHYPEGDFAPQLLGSTSVVRDEAELTRLDGVWPKRHTMKSRIGRTGIEQAYHGELAGFPGRRRLELDSEGQFSRIIEDESPLAGKRLVLGIDLEMSRLAEKRLAHWGDRAGYWPGGEPSGAFVAMDVDTGELLIWSEMPRFDLNKDLQTLYDPRRTRARADKKAGQWMPILELPEGMDEDSWRQQLCLPAPRALSRVMDLAVEPGSTFKPLIALAFLRSPIALPYGRQFTCMPDGRKPGCHNCGTIDLAGSICYSCNKYYSYSLRDFTRSHWPTYRRTVAEFIRDLHFGKNPIPEFEKAAKGQWLRGYMDFRVADILPRVEVAVGKALAKDDEAPLKIKILPRAGGALPDRLGGDPLVFERILTDVVKQIVVDTGVTKVGLVLTRIEHDGLASNYRFTLAPVGQAHWSRLPRRYDTTDPGTLPPALRRARNRLRFQFAGKVAMEGAFAHGTPFVFTARFDNEVGRTHEKQPEWIRGEDGRNVAIGQGPVLVTPLQMVRAMATIANDGYLVTPHVVRRVGERTQRWSREQIPMDKSHLNIIRRGMADAVTRGTARKAGFAKVRATVYGKTGTAQVGPEWRPFGKGPEDEPWHHWFVGFAEKPGHRRIAFACVLHARAEDAAGMTSAKATADILEAWFGGAPR